MATAKEEQQQSNEIESNKAKNETVITELHFDLLKHYAWLSSAIIGAIIILAQIGVTEMGAHVFVSLGLLGLSILISLTGQDHMVDSLLKGKSIYSIGKLMKVLRVTSLLCLGMGAGYFFSQYILTLS